MASPCHKQASVVKIITALLFSRVVVRIISCERKFLGSVLKGEKTTSKIQLLNCLPYNNENEK